MDLEVEDGICDFEMLPCGPLTVTLKKEDSELEFRRRVPIFTPYQDNVANISNIFNTDKVWIMSCAYGSVIIPVEDSTAEV